MKFRLKSRQFGISFIGVLFVVGVLIVLRHPALTAATAAVSRSAAGKAAHAATSVVTPKIAPADVKPAHVGRHRA